MGELQLSVLKLDGYFERLLSYEDPSVELVRELPGPLQTESASISWHTAQTSISKNVLDQRNFWSLPLFGDLLCNVRVAFGQHRHQGSNDTGAAVREHSLNVGRAISPVKLESSEGRDGGSGMLPNVIEKLAKDRMRRLQVSVARTSHKAISKPVWDRLVDAIQVNSRELNDPIILAVELGGRGDFWTTGLYGNRTVQMIEEANAI